MHKRILNVLLLLLHILGYKNVTLASLPPYTFSGGEEGILSKVRYEGKGRFFMPV